MIKVNTCECGKELYMSQDDYDAFFGGHDMGYCKRSVTSVLINCTCGKFYVFWRKEIC